MAKNAACCLVRKKFEKKEAELTKKEIEYGDFLARKYYPDDVLQFVSLYAEYVGCCSGFYVRCTGNCGRRINSSLKLPANKNDIYVDIEEYEAVCKFRNEWDKLKNQKDSILEYLKEEIFKLRTYNRVKEQAPELLPFLPKEKEEKKLPSVNCGNLRAFVKSIVETK